MKRWKILQELWLPFTRCHAATYAAAACFYLILSLFPTLLLLLSLLRHFPFAPEDVEMLTMRVLPAPMQRLLPDLFAAISGQKLPGLLSVSAVTAIWSASKGVLSVSDGLNAMLQTPGHRGYLRRRVRGMLYFLLFAGSLLLVLTVQVFGRVILVGLELLLPGVARIWRSALQLRFLYGTAMLTLVFTLLYRTLPENPGQKTACFTGALAASLGWMGLSYGFSCYLAWFPGAAHLYNGLGLVLLTLLWLQFSVVLLLWGGILSQLWSSGDYHPIQIIRTFFTGHF